MTRPCITPDCKAPNHCDVCGIHHPVDSMVTWCKRKAVRAESEAA